MGRRLGKVLAGILVFAMLFSAAEPCFAYENGERVRVGIFEMEGFHSYNEEGNLKGFCIDYLNVIAGITGWQYEFVQVKDFKDGLELLEKQEIDLIAPAMMSDDRKESFAYSDMYFGMEYTILLGRSDRDDLYYQDYKNYNGLKVAVLNGYPMTDHFITKLQTMETDVELRYFDNTEDCEIALKNGEVDAMLTSILYYADEYKLLDMFSPQPFYFLTYKDNNELLGELNDAMIRIQETYPTLLEELLYVYYPIYDSHFLTRKEAEYIAQGRVLKVAYVADRKPLSFTNEEGEFAGITRQVCNRIEQISGLKFEYVELPEGDITYEYLQSNEIDLITGVEYNSANMGSKGVYLSRPYITGRKVLVSRPDLDFSLDKNYKVAIVAGSKTFKTVIADKYPNMEIVEFATVEDCFRALNEGKADMLLQNQYVVETLMVKPVYSNFSVVPIEGVDDELCFSTIVQLNGGYGMNEKESPIVISILNKAISEIPDVEMDSIVMTQMIENQYELELLDFLYTYRYSIIMVSMALMMALALFIRVKKIQEEEARLKELQQKRYQTIIDCSDDMIYEISVDGKSKMSSEKIKEKFGWEIPLSEQTLDSKRVMEILHVYPEDEAIFHQTELGTGRDAFDNLTLRLCKADGTPVWCHVSRTVLWDKNNNPISILGKIVDVDDDVKEKQKLERRSRTDLLTGLLNKQTFEKEVRKYVENNDSTNCCFVFLDMDHFKEINDKFGHSMGDHVIKETAKNIQLLFANFDLVGRFGGDEFCVFVKDIPEETLVDRLSFAVKKMEKEYTQDGKSVTISASIGAAYCTRQNSSYQELMEMADAATYEAKANGRNGYVIKKVK